MPTYYVPEVPFSGGKWTDAEPEAVAVVDSPQPQQKRIVTKKEEPKDALRETEEEEVVIKK